MIKIMPLQPYTDDGMKAPSTDSRRYPTTIILREPACPECTGWLYRVRRRLIDRLISLIFPVVRYRCSSMGCDWEGNLRQRQSVRAKQLETYGITRHQTER